MTERLRSLSQTWRDIVELGDEQVAARVHGDGIDFLVDLTGHTANSRLSVFARKPAPIQVFYIGYCNTTGLPTIDYRLSDEAADPDGQHPTEPEANVRSLPEYKFGYPARVWGRG